MVYSERYLHTFLSTRFGHGFWNCRRKHIYFYKGLCGKSSILKNDCCLIAERDVSGLGTICTQRWLAELRVLQRRNTFLGAFAKLRKVTISFVMPVCPSVRPSAWNTSAPNARIFMTFYIWVGTSVAQWLRRCATNRKVAGSIPADVIGIFHWLNSSDRTMAFGSTQPLTEMSTRSIYWV